MNAGWWSPTLSGSINHYRTGGYINPGEAVGTP
jgi:hypothetical protein